MSLGNIAYHKDTEQLGKWYNHSASRAVDGDPNSDIYKGHCAHPLNNDNLPAWWRVDLGQLHVVINVTVYNRDEYKCEFKQSVNNFDV